MPPRGRPSRGRGAKSAVATTRTGGVSEDVKMPQEWDPSDDSDDEYKPGSKRKDRSASSRNAPSPKSARGSNGTPRGSSATPRTRPGPASRKKEAAGIVTASPSRLPPSIAKPSEDFKPVKMRYSGVSTASSATAGSSLMHDCVICDKKDGRNLKLSSDGIADLKYHYAVCYYEDDGVNRYRPYMDPGKLNMNSDGTIVEEYGGRFKYQCPFKDCAKNKAREKKMGFKEFCIHCGVTHHLVERVMEEDVESGRAQLGAVLSALARERGDTAVLEIPSVPVEEVHTCFICGGKDRMTGRDDKEARYLSLTEEQGINRTRYHYAQCLFDTGVYQPKYPPGPENTDSSGGVKDLLGREIKYSCRIPGCSQKRMMGYKEFCIHMGNEHGGLEEVLSEDSRQEVRDIVPRIRKKKVH